MAVCERDYGDWENPHTFEQALETLKTQAIDYEVRIDSHQGALMTWATWLEAVKDHSFIDYDGMGNQVSADGKIIGDGYIYPSTASTMSPDVAYILWYNR
jgi:hypothetical protein